MPSISVITICFNNLEELKATCASVDKQLLKPHEHIIIDGSTKTDIKEFLESNPQPVYRSWLCERDKGISDAFNKGIRKSRGDLIVLMNSGDLYYDEKVQLLVQELFEKDPELMWCNGMITTIRGGKEVVLGKPFKKQLLYRGMYRVYHQTMFVRKELYEKFGHYSESVKMAMDYDFLCRIAGEKNAFIPYPLVIFDNTGLSSSKYFESKKEAAVVYRKYYGFSFKQFFWFKRLSFLKVLIDSSIGRFLYSIKVKLGMANS